MPCYSLFICLLLVVENARFWLRVVIFGAKLQIFLQITVEFLAKQLACLSATGCSGPCPAFMARV